MSQPVPPNTSEITLPDVFAFHQNLILLNQAGVPLALGPDINASNLETQLGKLAATIAIESVSTPNLTSYLCESKTVPAVYSDAILEWHRSGGEVKSIEVLCSKGRQCAIAQRRIRNALIEPLALAIAGLVVMGLLLAVLVPWIERIYENAREQPDWSLRCLASIKPHFWTSFVPLFAFICLVAWMGRRGILNALLAVDAKLRGKGNGLSDSRSEGSLRTWLEKDSKRSPADLQFAMSVKQLAVSDHRSQLTRKVPAIVSVLLGGAIVLTVGLCLFYPMVQLLLNVAKP